MIILEILEKLFNVSFFKFNEKMYSFPFQLHFNCFQLNEITLYRESNMVDSPVNASIVCDEISPTSYSVSNPNSVTTDENGKSSPHLITGSSHPSGKLQ